MSRARLALSFGAVASFALARLAGPARAGDPPPAPSEVLADNDPAAVAYAGKVKEMVAERSADLERAYSEALEKTPCARAEVTMSIRVKPDGTITDAWAEPTPPLPTAMIDAVAAAFKTWKAPPTSGAKPVHLRVPLGAIPPSPPASALDCDAAILDRASYNVTDLQPGLERGAWRAICKPKLDAGGEVRAVKLRLKPFHSDAAGDDKGEMTGREVIVQGCEEPAFLFRGLHAVKNGPVPAAKVSAKIDAWDSTADIVLGGASYHLHIAAKPGPMAGTTERPWTILLDEGRTTEVLDTGHTTLAPLLYVRWAGDLDGDGKPDFVLEDHSNGVSLQLYVSGSAAGHRLVRRVAAISRGGR